MTDWDREKLAQLERRVNDLRSELFGVQRTLQLSAFVAIVFAAAIAGEMLRSLVVGLIN